MSSENKIKASTIVLVGSIALGAAWISANTVHNFCSEKPLAEDGNLRFVCIPSALADNSDFNLPSFEEPA